MFSRVPLRRAAAAVALFLPLAACGHEPLPAAEALPPMSVAVTSARGISVPERLDAGGVVAGSEIATISSRVVAPVQSVRVKAGERVRAGHILIVLDSRDVAAQASQASASADAAAEGVTATQSELASAAADHKLAASWHSRIAGLQARQSATTQELEDAEARLAAAAARLEGARARVQQAGANAQAARAGVAVAAAVRGFATLTAPFDGVVTESLVDAGTLAAPGVPLLRVESVGSPSVYVTIDESRAQFVRTGTKVEVITTVASPETALPIEGVVTEVSRTPDAGQRAFRVKVALPKLPELRSGTFARVRFAGTARERVVLPVSAVLRQGQLTSVFVVQDGVARLRLVHLGDTFDEGLEVLAGVKAGEPVVTSPPADLADGRRVTPAGAGGRQ